jgi:hypothetical protein
MLAGERSAACFASRAEGKEREKKKNGLGEGWARREKGRGEKGFGVFFLNSFRIHF